MFKKINSEWKVAKRADPFPPSTHYECPLCLALVPEVDFISTYRLIEGSYPPSYQIRNLCRACRDAGH